MPDKETPEGWSPVEGNTGDEERLHLDAVHYILAEQYEANEDGVTA